MVKNNLIHTNTENLQHAYHAEPEMYATTQKGSTQHRSSENTHTHVLFYTQMQVNRVHTLSLACTQLHINIYFNSSPGTRTK